MDESAAPAHHAADARDLDIEALRARLGPVKVALIEQWIREVVHPLDALAAQSIGPQTIVLDAGCGRGDPDLPSLHRAGLYLGCDVDYDGLRVNRLAHARLYCPLDRLPLADASVDCIVAKWVLEHLDAPGTVFAEWARVLRPGGRLCVLTPNAYSLFTLVSRVLSLGIKQRFKRAVFGLHEEDTFPTWYRANTRTALHRHLGAAGLHAETCRILPGMWTFFLFQPALARGVRAAEHAQARVPGARGAGAYLLGAWHKGECPA